MRLTLINDIFVSRTRLITTFYGSVYSRRLTRVTRQFQLVHHQVGIRLLQLNRCDFLFYHFQHVQFYFYAKYALEFFF